MTTIEFIIMCVLMAMVPACGEDGDDGTGEASDASSAEVAFSGVEELTRLHGKRESEVVSEMGPPDFEQELVLHAGETLPEFFIEVHNTYSPEDPAIEGRVIRHLQWDRDGYSEAVFMHRPDPDGEWIVLESVKWSEGVEF